MRPPDSQWCASPLAAPSTRGRIWPSALPSCLLSPSYLLRLRCVFSLLERASPWSGTACDGHHPFIRLYHTGRAHPARLKGDAHLQGGAAGASSTCHDGLLAPVARGFHGVALSGVVPPETRPRSWGAVVSVEYSSRTLPKSWQLCRKCKYTPLWCSGQGSLLRPLFHHTCTQEFPEQCPDVPVCYSLLDRLY